MKMKNEICKNCGREKSHHHVNGECYSRYGKKFEPNKKCKNCGREKSNHCEEWYDGYVWKSCKKFEPQGCGKIISGEYKDGGYWQMDCGDLGRLCKKCQKPQGCGKLIYEKGKRHVCIKDFLCPKCQKTQNNSPSIRHRSEKDKPDDSLSGSSGFSSLSDKMMSWEGDFKSIKVKYVRECITDIKREFMRRFYGSDITTRNYEEFLDFIKKRAGDELLK